MPEEFTPSDLMGAILSLSEATDHNFGTLWLRMDGVEMRITSLEGEVRGVKDELRSVKDEVRGVKDEVRGIKDWTRQVDQRFDAIAQAAQITGP